MQHNFVKIVIKCSCFIQSSWAIIKNGLVCNFLSQHFVCRSVSVHTTSTHYTYCLSTSTLCCLQNLFHYFSNVLVQLGSWYTQLPLQLYFSGVLVQQLLTCYTQLQHNTTKFLLHKTSSNTFLWCASTTTCVSAHTAFITTLRPCIGQTDRGGQGLFFRCVSTKNVDRVSSKFDSQLVCNDNILSKL